MQRFPLSAADFQLQSHGPVLFAMGMMLGTAWYFTINFEPGLWGITLFSLVVLLGGIVAVRYALANTLIVAFVVCCGAGMGALSGSLASARVQTVTVQSEMGPVRLEGWIENALPATRGTRLVIKVHAIDGLPSNETPKRVRLTHISALQTEPGRFVQCWAVLRPPPAPVLAEDYAFDRHAWYGGLGAVGYVQGRCRGGVMGGPQGASGAFSNWVSIQRRQLAQHVYEAAGLVSICCGGVWFVSATDRLHWAPSGDFYFEQSNGRVHRARLLDGDGLAPLRFADHPETISCPVELDCDFEIEGLSFVFNRANASLKTLPVQDALSQNEPVLDPGNANTFKGDTLHWQEVQAENGITLEYRHGAFQRVEKPACDSRPWRRC